MNQNQAKILVVDDEVSLREICQDALEDAGYEVHQAKNGKEALDFLHENAMDLVLSDLRMPVFNGLELLQRISKEKIDVEFLIMTGFGTIETAVESMKMGAADYLPKPFNINHLLLKVDKVLKERRERAERKNLSNLVRILNLTKDLNTQLDLSSLFNEFIFHLQRNFSPDGVGLYVADGERRTGLKSASVHGANLRNNSKVWPWLSRVIKLVLTKRVSKLVDPYVVNADNDLSFLVDEPLSHSLMVVPMYNQQQKVVGVVVLIRDGEQNLYTTSDLQLLTVFASHTATSIESARLYGQMREMTMDVIRSYAQAVEAKDIYTRGHSERVAHYATALGRQLGLEQVELDQLYTAGVLHDIGKIGVPDHILNKDSRLEADEYEVMKKHPAVGRDILSKVGTLQDILLIIYHHHERIDGHGYPEGLAGEDIPYLARLVSVVDSYEAMTSDRAYRRAMDPDKVKAILVEGAGKQWDRDLTRTWLSLLEDKDFVRELEGPHEA